MTETGMSLSFDALGLEAIQAKIATTAKSFQKLDREAKKLSGLGRALGRVATMGNKASGGALGGAFASIASQLGSFGIMANLTKQAFRQNWQLLGMDNTNMRSQLRRGGIVARRIGMLAGIGSGRIGRFVANNAPFVAAGARAIGGPILSGASIVAGAAGRRISAAAGAVGRAARFVGREAVIGAALMVGPKLIMSIGGLIKSVSVGLLGGVAIAATFLVAAVGAYFKLDKSIGKAMKWVSENIFTPISKGVSSFFTAWKDAFAQLTDRGEWLTTQFNPTNAARQYSPEQRRVYEQNLKMDLEGKDWEEGIESQIQELRDLWKRDDEKMQTDSKRIVEAMYFEARI